MGQSSQKLKVGMIRFDNQIQFSPKAAVISSAVKVSTIKFAFVQGDSVFISSRSIFFSENMNDPKCQSFVYVWCFFILEILFLQSYRLIFGIKISINKLFE